MFSAERNGTSVTISDIARELGVSKSTVSRVINCKGRIGESTRQRVQDCVRNHDYRPNTIARSLAQKRTYNIAVVIPRDADRGDVPFFQNCLVGISEVIYSRGFDAILAVEEGDETGALRRLVSNRKVDGVVLLRLTENDAAVEFLEQEKIPFVAMGTSDDAGVVQVDNDQVSGCMEMTDFMIKRGCFHMALLGGDGTLPVNGRRYEGFKQACEKNNISLNESHCWWNLDSESDINRALPEIMRENPQCLVCADDVVCSRVLKWLSANGYEVPADIQVISFYDSPVLESHDPPVTALCVSAFEMSRCAGNLVLDLIEGKKVSRRHSVGYEIKIRESFR